MGTERGVIAAGHPLTAQAGAQVLREGGNAMDAAVAAVLTSFVAESPLTGIGAGGFMLVHTPGGESHLLDFFVQAPAVVAPASEQIPIVVDFEGAKQVFHCGPATCAAYGTAAGLWTALERFGTVAMVDLAGPAIELARSGVATTEMHEFLYRILEPIITRWPECRGIYAPDGSVPRAGDVLRMPDIGDAIDRLAQDGPDAFYRGEVAQQVCEWLQARGGTLSSADLAAYTVEDRTPGRLDYRGHTVVTNPPPSSGGTLIAASLLGLSQSSDVDALALVRASEAANRARDDGFSQHLHDADFFETFLAGLGRGGGAGGPGETDVVGSTTHISVLDANGMAVSCTCSNGSGSGVAVPGTGVILNNMLGETDLNPLGVGRTRPSARITSMMAPTIVLRDGNPQLVLGSAGSNRIRSAILQVIAHVVDHGMSVEEAVNAPRVHFEDGVVQAEPGIGEEQLAALEAAGLPIVHWAKQNLFFGGCQAVGRSTSTSTFEGAGDPRRGGVAILA